MGWVGAFVFFFGGFVFHIFIYSLFPTFGFRRPLFDRTLEPLLLFLQTSKGGSLSIGGPVATDGGLSLSLFLW